MLKGKWKYLNYSVKEENNDFSRSDKRAKHQQMDEGTNANIEEDRDDREWNGEHYKL